VEYFEMTNYQELCSVQDKLEYIVVDFVERNELPNGYSFDEYETKDFMSSKLIQDFPIRGKGVYLRITKRRWWHKQTGAILKRDYSFMAEGSKFTAELSDFLKDAGGYKARYHNQYSELLQREEQNSSETL
jgi:transposase